MIWHVVVPTNRPEKFKTFLKAWRPLFDKHNVHLVICEDAEYPSELGLKETDTHLCWQDVPLFIPRKTDMIRSWGFYQVWKNLEYPEYHNETYLLTLDDDTVPVDDPFAAYEKVFNEGAPFSSYLSVGALTSSNLQMRGFPYKNRKPSPVAVQYGGWEGVLDFDAATQLAIPQKYNSFKDIVMPVPVGAATTCCIMNTAFHVSAVPIMWQLPMLNGRYNRIGDIWSGLFIKKTLDAIGRVMVINGKANVVHDRASDPYNSLTKEAPSVWLNDNIWENLATPSTTDMIEAYREVTDSAIAFLEQHDKEYAKHFKHCRDAWLDLF